ncbi:MAG: polyphosphate polymerase domain-containing protein [Lentimicrobium sp.]|nr:polyphosphate polymerase domain-containing protein [Lentimicrobium sp.]
MNELLNLLHHFRTISLDQMDQVQLLNRIDTKYILKQVQLTTLLGLLTEDYFVLSIDGELLHPYETLYFDTPAYDLYLMHHNGHRNRYKLRFRKYVNSGISFFEVKLKTNTRRTIKRRISVSGIAESLTLKQKEFVEECTNDGLKNYLPSLRVKFNRITLVNLKAGERLTIDTNLRYEDENTEKGIGDIVIVEVKQQKQAFSPFRKLMLEKRLREFYLSKYCLGITCLHEDLKKNRFKRKLLALNKLGYDVS